LLGLVAGQGDNPRVLVRAAEPGDVPAIQRVSQRAGQTGDDTGVDAAYVEFVLATARVLVAEDGGPPIGWGAVRPTPVGEMLTDLFVDPDQHGRGIGRALLDALWPDPDRPGRFTFSSQHPSALPVYARAGLRPIWPLLYLTGSAPSAPSSPSAVCVRMVSAADAAAVDAELTGGSRASDYAFWTRASPGEAFIVTSDDRTIAAGARRGGELMHLTCPDASVAAAALYAALAAGPIDAEVCLPGPHPAVVPLLRAGWRVTDLDLAMTTPDVALPVTWAYSTGLA
jgi:GNAT superfamily N-acetyltransferase